MSAEIEGGATLASDETQDRADLVGILDFACNLIRTGENQGAFWVVSALETRLGPPPERKVVMPNEPIKQKREREKRKRLAQHIKLAYFAGVLDESDLIPAITERLKPQSIAIVLSAHMDGAHVRINKEQAEEDEKHVGDRHTEKDISKEPYHGFRTS